MDKHTDDFRQGGAISKQAHLAMLKKERTSNNAWHKFSRNKAAVAGLCIVAFMFLIAIFAPVLAPYDPNEINLIETFLKPGENGHLFGTDDFGRDLLSRIIYGARMSVVVAIGSTLVGGVCGALLGLVSGFFGGAVDAVIMRLMDGMFAFPFILLSIFLVTILGPGVFNVILAIGIASIPNFARVVRGQVRIVKSEEYCQVEKVLGASKGRIIFSHVLPNTMSQIIVFATLNVAAAILNEASLSFLGLGILTPNASWGNILRAGKISINTAPHISIISGLFIFITVIGFNLFGDGVRDVLDPKAKR